MLDLIRTLEEAALPGLPPLRFDIVDGWLLRFADGYSRRANSVAPLYSGQLDLDDKIERCERAYERAGQPCLFKLTDAAQPPELDAALERRGYARDADTLVCTRQVGAESVPATVEVLDVPDGEWFDTWCRLTGTDGDSSIFGRLLAATPQPTAYALARCGGHGVACGRATLAGSWVGLYDLQVDPLHRRQGLATALTQARLAWAGTQGAQSAFLQVMANNTSARAMQTRLGFSETYRYWYRIQPGQDPAARC